MIAPFADVLSMPHVKFAGAGGEPLASAHAPASLDEALEMLLLDEPRSVVLHLEELDTVPAPFDAMLSTLLPLGHGVTAHVYISNRGASALRNHTDKTEVIVAQLAGRKEWLYCREREQSASPPPSVPSMPWMPEATRAAEALAAKLPKCKTYEPEEMASENLECNRVTTEPGDAFHLPRRTIHSARAVGDDISVHLTLAMKCAVAAAAAAAAIRTRSGVGLRTRRRAAGRAATSRAWAVATRRAATIRAATDMAATAARAAMAPAATAAAATTAAATGCIATVAITMVVSAAARVTPAIG